MLFRSQAEHYTEAQVEFQQVVKSQPDNFQARFLNGMCLFYAGKFNPAIAELEKVYAAQSENISVAYALANAYIQNEQIDKGQVLVDKVFKNLNSAEAHLIIGSFNLARKELQPAAEELRQAVEMNPKLPTAHSQLGVVYLMTGNRDLAIKAFHDELALSPNDFVANTRLGWLYREDNRLDEGEKLLKRSLELRPNDPAPMFQLAQLVNAQGKPEEAAKYLEAVVAQLPNYNQAHVLLARIYFKLKRSEDAKREQAIITRLTAEQQKIGRAHV